MSIKVHGPYPDGCVDDWTDLVYGGYAGEVGGVTGVFLCTRDAVGDAMLVDVTEPGDTWGNDGDTPINLSPVDLVITATYPGEG